MMSNGRSKIIGSSFYLPHSHWTLEPVLLPLTRRPKSDYFKRLPSGRTQRDFYAVSFSLKDQWRSRDVSGQWQDMQRYQAEDRMIHSGKHKEESGRALRPFTASGLSRRARAIPQTLSLLKHDNDMVPRRITSSNHKKNAGLLLRYECAYSRSWSTRLTLISLSV